MAIRIFFCLYTFLSFLTSVCKGYFVNVDAHNVECFFDKATTGMKMSLAFEVVEGGFLDIDVEVCLFKFTINSTITLHTD